VGTIASFTLFSGLTSLLALRRRSEDTYDEDIEAEHLGGYLYLDKADRLLKRRLNPVVDEHDAHELPAPHVIAAEWGSSGRRIRSRAANIKVE
jgi:hypothetical protein